MLPDFAKLKWPFWTRIYSESGLQAIVYMYILYCTYIIHICVYKCICICTCMYLYIYLHIYSCEISHKQPAASHPVGHRLVPRSCGGVGRGCFEGYYSYVCIYMYIVLYYITIYICVCPCAYIHIYYRYVFFLNVTSSQPSPKPSLQLHLGRWGNSFARPTWTKTAPWS